MPPPGTTVSQPFSRLPFQSQGLPSTPSPPVYSLCSKDTAISLRHWGPRLVLESLLAASLQENSSFLWLVPSPGLSSMAPGSRGSILGGGALVPVLRSFFCTPGVEIKKKDAQKKVHKNPKASSRNSAGAEAAEVGGFRRVSPSLPLPSLFPLALPVSLPFFFLEGQVVTLHCLLATASTALSNRSAGCGPLLRAEG